MDIQEALETVKEAAVDKTKDIVEKAAESEVLNPKKGSGILDMVSSYIKVWVKLVYKGRGGLYSAF